MTSFHLPGPGPQASVGMPRWAERHVDRGFRYCSARNLIQMTSYLFLKTFFQAKNRGRLQPDLQWRTLHINKNNATFLSANGGFEQSQFFQECYDMILRVFAYNIMATRVYCETHPGSFSCWLTLHQQDFLLSQSCQLLSHSQHRLHGRLICWVRCPL